MSAPEVRQDIDHTMVRDLQRFIKKISQIHPEAVIVATSYNQGTSRDGRWAQSVV